MANEISSYPIVLVKGGSYFREFHFFQDAAGTIPVDLTGKDPRFLVKYGSGPTLLEWTVAGGHVAILGGNQHITLTLTTAQINALTFKAASYYIFLDGEDELLPYSGAVQVK